jgi:hypothetical protein
LTWWLIFLKVQQIKKRGDACQHLALATSTPETVAELEFGEILNCYELNWLLENFLLLGMKTRTSSYRSNSLFKHHNKVVLILTIGSYIRLYVREDHIIKAFGSLEVQLQEFLTRELDGNDGVSRTISLQLRISP